MKYARDNGLRPSWSIAIQPASLVVCALMFSQIAYAQSAEELAEQQVEAMRQYMKAAGVGEDQMGPAEAIITGTAQQVDAKEAAEYAQAKRELEARTAGLGTANVIVDGNTYEYQVTKCEKGQGDTGSGYRIEAQHGPADRDGTLRVTGDSHYNRLALQLINPDGFWEAHSYPLPELEGNLFEWVGTVEGDRGKTQLAMSISCGNAP